MPTNKKICPIMSVNANRREDNVLELQPCLESCGFYNEQRKACSLNVLAMYIPEVVNQLDVIGTATNRIAVKP